MRIGKCATVGSIDSETGAFDRAFKVAQRSTTREAGDPGSNPALGKWSRNYPIDVPATPPLPDANLRCQVLSTNANEQKKDAAPFFCPRNFDPSRAVKVSSGHVTTRSMSPQRLRYGAPRALLPVTFATKRSLLAETDKR